MPRYDFRCPACGQVYEVARPMSRAAEPLVCPRDQATCERVISMPMVLMKSDGSVSPASPQQSAGWSHFGHSHSAGTGSHDHPAGT